MSSVSKEDIQAIQKKKFRVIFSLGLPGSGSESKCLKLVNEFKYTYLSIQKLIEDEKNSKSKLSETLQSFSDKNEDIPNEIAYSLLIKALVSKKGHTFIIGDFPKSLEQAFFLEKSIKEIKIILNFENSVETSIKREKILKATFNQEEFIQEIEKYKQSVEPLIQMYQNYGVIRTIVSEGGENEIYENLKEIVFPEIYCIIGKKYSGKTEISKILSSRTGMKIIDFQEFLKEPLIAKKSTDPEFVIKQFINRLREEEEKRVIVEDFPMNKEYYTIFVQNCKNIKKIYYLNSDNNECSERMRKLGINHKNYIGCSELNKFLTDFENKKTHIDYLKKKKAENFIEINVNKTFKLVVEDLMSIISPNILIFHHDSTGTDMKNNLLEYFKTRRNYQIIDVAEVLQEYIERNHPLGIELEESLKIGNKKIPNRLKIECLKPILFNEKNNNFILVNYPEKQEDIIEFEENVCKIVRYVYVSKTYPLELKLHKSEVEVYFKKNNRFFIYSLDDINEYVIEDILGVNRDFNIAYGMPNAGENLINSHLEKNYKHKVIDMIKYIESLKNAKAGPDNDPESIVVDLPMLLAEFKNYIKDIPKNQKICVENLINPVTNDLDSVIEILKILGKPRYFFEIICNEIALIDKYKAKNEIAEDLNEEQKIEFERAMEIPKKIVEFVKNNAYKTIKIDTSFSEAKSLNNFDYNFGRNLIVIKHDYQANIDNVLYLIAAANKILYVNVPYLIYKQFYLNNQWAKKLENSYNKKELRIDDYQDFERKIYKVYNPLHFEENLVNDLILNYINENSKENEDNENMVILSGYLNYDLLPENEGSFNLPIYEIKKLLNIGYMMSFLNISHNEIITQENEVPVLLEVIKPKVVEKKDDLDISQEAKEPVEEPEKKEEEGESEKPKFKPEGFSWTSYDGHPRNYIQVASRFTKYPILEEKTNLKSLENTIMNILSNDIKNKEGIIHLVKF